MKTVKGGCRGCRKDMFVLFKPYWGLRGKGRRIITQSKNNRCWVHVYLNKSGWVFWRSLNSYVLSFIIKTPNCMLICLTV